MQLNEQLQKLCMQGYVLTPNQFAILDGVIDKKVIDMRELQ